MAGRPKNSMGGSISYNKERNRYILQYYVIDTETQNEKRVKKNFKTKEEAETFLSTLQYQKGNELFIKNNGIPLNQLMRSVVQRKLDMNIISPGQYSRVLKTIKLIEKSPIVKRKIDDLTSDDIQEYINSLKNYSNSYIKKLMEQFTQAYKYAFNKGYISKNPMVDVIKPKSTKEDKIIRALTIEEQQIFTNYLMRKTIEEEPYKNVYLIQMYMGLRVGEALALQSNKIDLNKNLIKVKDTLTIDENGNIVIGKTTKTKAGEREIPIPPFIRESLIEQIEIAKYNKDNQLFLSPNGRLIDGRNVNRILKKRLKELGIEGISTHSLRHTYGTRCVEAGMRAVALQRLMGHNDVSVTLNTYTSVFNKFKETELEKVNEYYLNYEIFSPTGYLEELNLIKEVEYEEVKEREDDKK